MKCVISLWQLQRDNVTRASELTDDSHRLKNVLQIMIIDQFIDTDVYLEAMLLKLNNMNCRTMLLHIVLRNTPAPRYVSICWQRLDQV
jgi:hypothetical protein